MKKIIEHFKNWRLAYLVLGVPLVLFTIIILSNKNKELENVHWHMNISYDICGNTKPFSDEGSHSKLHGHNDDKIHIEGVIDKNNRSETLGGYFDSFNMPFDDTKIGNITNGTKCPGSKTGGKLKVIVNGKQISNVRDYILQKDDDIKIIFK